MPTPDPDALKIASHFKASDWTPQRCPRKVSTTMLSKGTARALGKQPAAHFQLQVQLIGGT